MTTEDTHPDLPVIPPETEESREPRMRPRDRRIVQAIALLCAVSALLGVQWLDETNNVEKNLKPPEKVTTVPAGAIGEFLGARWKVMKREKAQPLATGAQKGAGDVTELRLSVGVRPGDAASAKTVGAYGLVYRLVDGDGRVWSATGTAGATARAGVAMLVTVRATVPRSKADSVELEIQAPKSARKKGEPLASLRFDH
ncbi:hypothetical protein E1281_06410 [Actinomadura sp. KC345]|uniref:hypothetical protein n=1 Tax=Actinomadura sp. KC345 TaxID=2530371 RepID=UPI00105402BF|nr:hypothetical protein [Actinomadura sp. KC345]TDC56865.1 hypothetical protein E1281_06410 [Actinomadura sp. KC345]